jgi:hypothetical protein
LKRKPCRVRVHTGKQKRYRTGAVYVLRGEKKMFLQKAKNEKNINFLFTQKVPQMITKNVLSKFKVFQFED